VFHEPLFHELFFQLAFVSRSSRLCFLVFNLHIFSMSKRRIVNKLFDDSSARSKGPQPHTANSQIINKSSTKLSTTTDISGENEPPAEQRGIGDHSSRYAASGMEIKPDSSLPDYDLNGMPSVARTQQPQRTELQRCVDAELTKYFAMLENDPPKDLYQLVMSQVESAVINYVLDVCGNNQSRAAVYLGISRGKLRSRIKELSL